MTDSASISAASPPPPPADGPLDRFLCFAVYGAGLAFNRLYKGLLEDFGLTYPQYLALYVLGERGPLTVSQLGDILYLESNTLTPMLKRLEAAGHVSRSRDTADERVVRVALTDEGKALVARFDCVPARVLEATGMSLEQVQALTRSISDLGTRLRAAGE